MNHWYLNLVLHEGLRPNLACEQWGSTGRLLTMNVTRYRVILIIDVEIPTLYKRFPASER
ncbi:Hin recombinase [Citrobacter youngae]|nr:Hin recombinase [Citrobacter youngae]